MAFPLPLLLPLLLVLGAVPVMGGSTISDLDTACPAETTITDMDDKETINLIRWEGSTELLKGMAVYVHPDEGFKGVSLRAVLGSTSPSRSFLDQESHVAFVPLDKDICFNNTAWWWFVGAKVDLTPRNNNSNNDDNKHDLSFYLQAGGCEASCTVNLHGASYKTLDPPEMVGYGPSRWTREPDRKNCTIVNYMDVPIEEYNSCLKPPGTTQDTTAVPESTEDNYNFTIALMTTMTALTVTVMVLGYFVGKEADLIMEKRERSG